MENEIIITGYSNITKEGVTLHLNKKTSLKTVNIKSDYFRVSWDKIGKALFNNYTERKTVKSLDELRNQY